MMFIRTERSVQEFIQFYPIVTVLLIINIILYILMHLFSSSFGGVIYTYGVGHNLSIYVNQEYWRFITPIFLHGNLGHVLFNSFALVLFGPALERMVGKFLFVLIYLGTGIIGNIGTYIINPQSMVPHLGASGAIYGLFGIYIYMTFKRRNLIDEQSAQIVRIIFIIGLVMTFIRPNINIAAHIFGFIGGLLLAPLTLKRAIPFRKPVYRQKAPSDDVAFDPHRWQKKRSPLGKLSKNIVWIIIIIVILLLLAADY